MFEFELLQGSVVPGAPDPREAEDKRLEMVSARMRGHLADAGFELADIASVAGRAEAANLQSCGGCAADFAREVDADYALTGFVYKVSELILSINVRVNEAETSKTVVAVGVDLRGNTDESWQRGVDYLYKNLLSPRLENLKK